MRLKSIPVILVSLIGLSTKLWACGPETSYSWIDNAYRPYFFSLALSELKALESSPLCQADAASPEMAQAEMLKGWFLILGDLPATEEAEADLLYLINETPIEQLKNFKKALGEDIPTNFQPPPNLAVQTIIRNKNLPALDYLIFMRELDKAGILLDLNKDSWDYWAFSSKELGGGDIFAYFVDQAGQGYENQKNPELKWRYAFQLTRLYFYQGDYQSLVDFFARKIAPQPYHPVREWCRSFYGGALAAQNKLAAALKEFALVLYRSAYYRASARSSIKIVFSRATETDIEAAAAMGQDEVEEATIRSVLNYHVKSNHYLNLLTTLVLAEQGGEVPLSLENDLVLAIGHLEKSGYGKLKSDFSGATNPSTKELERLILALAPKRGHPAFWYLGAAHLAILRGEADRAKEHIAQAAAAGAESYLPRQLALTKLLQAAYLEPLNGRGEDIIGRRLQEFDQMRLGAAKAGDASGEGQASPAIAEAMRGVLEVVLGTRYQVSGRNDRAFFCLAVSNNWLGGNKAGDFFHIKDSYELLWPKAYVGLVLADPEALKSIRQTVVKPRGELEKFFTAYSDGWTPNVLTELLGMARIFRHDFKTASQELAVLDSSYKTWAEIRYQVKTPGNPFKYSPTGIFGYFWRDDFKNFFETTAAVLTEKELQTLVQTIRSPKTFFEFAAQADELADLSRAEGELGLTAAYFYALSLYNIHIFPYWDQSCRQGWSEDLGMLWATTYESQSSYRAVKSVFDIYVLRGSALEPDPVETEIKPLLLRVTRQTQNPELAARANFFLAGLDQLDQKGIGWRYVGLSNKDIKIEGPVEFLTYYRALNDYRDTEFVKAMNFRCPEAKYFLDSAKPVPTQREPRDLPLQKLMTISDTALNRSPIIKRAS